MTEKVDRVPFVNFKRQYQLHKKEFDSVWEEIISNGDFILRRHLEDFEKEIARYVGVKHAIGVNTGTDALYLSARALGWGKGDEIITVGHTFVATIASIIQCGATPILIDVGKDFNMDLSQIEAAITPNTKGIIPVHLNGRSCDMEKIMELAKKHNLKVLEDGAQALGSKYKGKMANSWGDAGIISFYPAKMLGTAGDGGMITTNDSALARKLYGYRDNGRVDSVEVIEDYGWCSRLDNLHAAILSMKFKHFQGWVERRREIAQMYNDALKDIEGLSLCPAPETESHFDVYQNYVIRTEKRDELKKHLAEKNVETLISWKAANHKQKALTELNKFNLPETDAICDEVISLPMYPELNNEEVSYVIEAVKSFFE